MGNVYKLKGVHRHYDWGGSTFIPSLFGIENATNKPFAEYWMGAHPSAPSLIDTEKGELDLIQFIQNDAAQILGNRVLEQFGALPYLFKILDVAKMLSIQVHPNIESAVKGFDREALLGIAMDAPYRNYKDKNHKPEVMVALSDFWLLHGFLPAEQIESVLSEHQRLQPFLEIFKKESYKGLYQQFMELPQTQVDQILLPLVNESIEKVANGLVDKSSPAWWVNKYYNGMVPTTAIDKGIFSIFIMNIMFVSKFQAVYQSAGVLHAYLEGQNIELMANSDNVLRGGLTTKHVDVPELLQHIHFVPTYPKLIEEKALNAYEINYPCPIQDFGLSKISIPKGESYIIQSNSLEILLLMEGEVSIDGVPLVNCESLLVLPGKIIEIRAEKASNIFRAYVP